MNLSGTTQTADVVDICNMPVMPANPLTVLQGSCIGPFTANCSSYTSAATCPYDQGCGWTGEDTSSLYRCNTTSYDICYVKRIRWAVSINLESANLPFSGQTEAAISDSAKVNGYLSWYLNGTIQQSEKLPLDTYSVVDNNRITTFSGPINKLVPKDFRDPLKQNLATAGIETFYHDYLVACQRNIDLNYITEVLASVFDLIFGNIFDNAHFAWILLREGIQNLGQVGRAIIQIASLPPQDFDLQHASQIMIMMNLSILGNDLDSLNELLSLGRDILLRVGAVASSLRTDMAEACDTSGSRRRLSWVASHPYEEWIKRYVSYSTLEDTTSEITVSVIPSLQPADIDGRILAISLWINAPTDSRLYFPHLRSTIALSQLVNSLHQPITSSAGTCTGPSSCTGSSSQATCPADEGCAWIPSSSPNGLSYDNHQLVRQAVGLHQGIDDVTAIQREYSNGTLIRNTEVIENHAAPAALYTPGDATCDLDETRSNQGDKLLGTAVNGTLTYYQLFQYSPREVIDCSSGCNLGASSNGTLCVTEPCIAANGQCNLTTSQCCTDELQGGYGGSEGNCPWLSECQHADADYFCVPTQYDCVSGDYHEIYPFSCEGRGGDRAGWICCGPQAAPDYNQVCTQRPLTGVRCVGALPQFDSFCSGLDSSCTGDYTGVCTTETYPIPNDYDCEGLLEGECNAPPANFYCTTNSELAYPGHTATPNPPHCPAWPNRDLRSAARIHPFTKTPFVEKIYDLLVANPQSLLRRWLPQLPLSENSSLNIETGKNDTIPAVTSVGYVGTSQDLIDTRVTAGAGSGAALYFPYLGSISDYLLGTPKDPSLNLQCLLRPGGSCARFRPACDTQLITDLASQNSSGTCGICNSNLGDLARGILTAAGETFHVSAGAIYATMLHEGATWTEFAGQFNDENVLKWSIPEWCGGEPMPRCDNESEATQAPFGWIRYWFYLGEGDNAVWNAVEEIDPSRNSKDRVSRCNFMDAAFATAKALSIGTAYVPAGAAGLSNCAGYSLNNTSRPTTCNWNNNIFAQSQVSYAGYCPDNPNGTPYPQIPDWTQRAVNDYNQFSCF
jgi:hypothetical protein